MHNRGKFIVLLVLMALALVSGCQSTPRSDGGGPAESTPTPQKSTEPEAAPAETAKAAVETLRTIETDNGEVKVTPLEHGSLVLSWGDRTIFVDPTTSALDSAPDVLADADLVLVTHIHGDHLDPQAIAKVRGEGAKVVAPQSVADKAGDALPDPEILANGETTQALDGTFEIKAFPMYNLVRKRENGEFYHPKGRGNGYILTVGGAKIYISGDTECTPEIKALEGINAAFLSMNLPYTMPVEEAAECVRAFEPEVLFPYHYRGQDLSKLVELLEDATAVEVRLLEWYAQGEGSK